jgi:hypothetical protein
MPEQDCAACRGYGEVAVPGTYGPTISPENLETRECAVCQGEGTVVA